VLDYGFEHFFELRFVLRCNWRFHRLLHRTSVANLDDGGLSVKLPVCGQDSLIPFSQIEAQATEWYRKSGKGACEMGFNILPGMLVGSIGPSELFAGSVVFLAVWGIAIFAVWRFYRILSKINDNIVGIRTAVERSNPERPKSV
jgi:hypothetical protein